MENTTYIPLTQKDYINGEQLYELVHSNKFLGTEILPSITPYEIAIQVPHFFLLKRETRGGTNSGFHGHKGRPGEVGGSAPSDSEVSHKYGKEKPEPHGLFEAISVPPIDDLSYNYQREKLAIEAKKGISDISTKYPKLKGKIEKVEICGSFISDKEQPKDLDLLVKFNSEESLKYYLTEIYPEIKYSYGKVEFMGWSDEYKDTYEEYKKETENRYDTKPIDVSEWIGEK